MGQVNCGPAKLFQGHNKGTLLWQFQELVLNTSC